MQTTTSLDHNDAMRALNAVREQLVQQSKGAVVAVVDAYGELLGFFRVGNASLPSANIATNKVYTAARNPGPTGDMGKLVRDPVNGFHINYFGTRASLDGTAVCL